MRAVGIEHYAVLSGLLMTIGLVGLFLARRNVIMILMCVELMLLSANLNLVAFSAFQGDLTGQVFTMFVLSVAAAEVAIGLAIMVSHYRRRRSIAIKTMTTMRG